MLVVYGNETYKYAAFCAVRQPTTDKKLLRTEGTIKNI